MRTHVLVAIGIMVLLTACGMQNTQDDATKQVEELTKQAFLLNENKKAFMAELSQESIEDLFFQIKDENDNLTALSEFYGSVTEGLTDNDKGQKVNCYKLPVTITFSGNESLIKEFLDALQKLDVAVAMNKFDVTEENGEYRVDCLISFIGTSAKAGVGGSSNSFSLVKKDKAVKEEEEIVLRDFDVNLTIRPSNSDAAAVTLSTESGKSLTRDENEETDVKVSFYKEESQFYCQYSVGGQTQTDKITVGDKVKFDVLSCKRKLDTDQIKVNLTIENRLEKAVSVIVYNDLDGRVKITKSGSVEVEKK
ncbi:MAG: hypothetical protein J6M02_07025 [Clostridia bacterium]|nr:hypothetical protein [Clostridia bacterium]